MSVDYFLSEFKVFQMYKIYDFKSYIEISEKSYFKHYSFYMSFCIPHRESFSSTFI